MKFRVIGVNRETGRAVKPLLIDAESEKAALEIANKAGMMVERIEVITDPHLEPVFVPIPGDRIDPKKAQPAYASLNYLADWFGVLAFINLVASAIVIVICLGKLSEDNDSSIFAFTIAFGIGAASTILTLFALAEGIRLMIEIASSLREIRDRLPKN